MILKCSKEAGNSLYPLLKTYTHRVIPSVDALWDRIILQIETVNNS